MQQLLMTWFNLPVKLNDTMCAAQCTCAGHTGLKDTCSVNAGLLGDALM